MIERVPSRRGAITLQSGTALDGRHYAPMLESPTAKKTRRRVSLCGTFDTDASAGFVGDPVEALLDSAVREGVPRQLTIECCRSLRT